MKNSKLDVRTMMSRKKLKIEKVIYKSYFIKCILNLIEKRKEKKVQKIKQTNRE